MNIDNGHHRHSVLIVDDERGVLAALTGIFKPDDYTIWTATGADEALEILSVSLPCLVLSDVSMSGMDGYALCREIRNNPKTAHVPVALLTGKITDEDFEKGIAAGALDYIKKPFDRAEIRLRVRNLMNLHESSRKRQQLFDCAPQGILAANAATKHFVMVNDAMCKMLGYSEQELLRMSIEDIHPEDAFAEILSEFEECSRKKKDMSRPIPCKRKDGSVFYAEISSSLVTIDDIPCRVAFFNDITERLAVDQRLRQEEAQLKHMEAELRHAQKMEAVGRLASGIAHEINTPTQFVGDNIRFLADSFNELIEVTQKLVAQQNALKNGISPDTILELCETVLDSADFEFIREEIPNAIDQSLEGVSRIASIVRAMKEFAHPGDGNMMLADINKMIQTTVTVSKNEWKYSAEMKLLLDESLPQILCLPGEMNQVLLNLIVNAAHAVAEATNGNGKGTIEIATRQCDDSVEVRIADTGCGIPLGIQDKIMEPFFTTKEVGRGTGQGLAIARSVVVDKHRGKLWFESEPGIGTTFVISLPLEHDSEPMTEGSG